jgi:hypothetical protein
MVRWARKKKDQQKQQEQHHQTETGGAAALPHPHPMGLSHFDTFVAAWFHPDGVHSMPVSTSTHPIDLSGNNDSGNNDDNNSNYHVSANEPVRRVQEAVFEWRGYRHASQVLVPFGYATSFLDGVVEPPSQSYTSDEHSDASEKYKVDDNYALVLQPKMVALCQD